LAGISVTPVGGFGAGDYSQWLDISTTTWNNSGTYSKQWTESSTNHDLVTAHTIGNLNPSQYYTVSYTKAGESKAQLVHLQANSSGKISFTYNQGYSDVTFDVEPDVAPVITLNGSNPQTITLGSTYTEFGAVANDVVDGLVTATSSGTVNNMVLGNYTITYTAIDSINNIATSTRTVTVIYSGGGTQIGSTSISSTPSLISTPTPTPAPTPIHTTPTDSQSILNSLLQQLADLQQQLANQQGGSTHYQFTHGLQYGNTGEDVTQLQTFLKSQGTDIYPEGLITGYFGNLTKLAVQRFQLKYNIAKSGDAGYGYVGPKTRAKINSL
jgi:peptidoglycan hydrolase-like protein with peptidoglycan-binding domain